MANKTGRKLKSWLNQHFADQQIGEESKKSFSLKTISEKILPLEKEDKAIVEFCLRDYENYIDAAGRKIQGFEELKKRMAENKGQMMAIIEEGTRMVPSRHSPVSGSGNFNPHHYKIEKIGIISAPFIIKPEESTIIINFKKMIIRGNEPGWAKRAWRKYADNMQIFYPGNASALISSTIGNDKVNKLYHKEADRIQKLLGLIKYELYDAVMALKESEKKREIIRLMERNGLITKEELIENINDEQSERFLMFGDRERIEKRLKDLKEYVETHIPNSKGVIVSKEKPEKPVTKPSEQKPTLIRIEQK